MPLIGSPPDLKIFERTKGLTWNDGSGNKYKIYVNGDTITTDAKFASSGSNSTLAQLTLTAAASRIIPGATSVSFRNNANTFDNLIITDAGNATLRGSFTFATASGRIVPGATQLSFRNNANNADNVVILDSGQVAIGGGTSASTANLFCFDNAALPNDANSYSSVNMVAQNAGTGSQLTNTKRILNVQGAMSGTFTQGTYAAIYGTATNSGTGGIIHHIGTVGAVDFTANVVFLANSISAGLYSFIQVTSGTPSIDRAIGVWSAGLPASGLTANIYAGLWSAQTSVGTNTIVDAYGCHVEMPSGATGNNMGVQIGTRFTATATVGLHVGSAGAWIRGVATAPPADTSALAAQLVIWAGNNAAANDTQCTLHFYRSSTVQGFIGYDSNASVVNAGHTKLVTDLILGNNTLLVDTNGQIYGHNSIRATTGLFNVESVVTSGNLPTGLTIQNALHTGLNVTATRQVYFNFGNAIASFGAGGGTAATMDGLLVGSPQYSAAAAMTITKASTVRISGAPSVSATAGFAPALTTTYALSVDTGNSFFGGSVIQSHAPAAINSTNTATVAQTITGYITSTSAAPTTITLPTATLLGATLGAVQGTIFYLTIDNTAGANLVTIAMGANITPSALATAFAAEAGLLTVPSGITGQATFQIQFSSATVATYTRIA